MKMLVKFLADRTEDVYDVSRVPCVGEYVVIGLNGDGHEVMQVIHVLNPESGVQAVVRVK